MLFCFVVLTSVCISTALYQWSFQQKLTVPDAGSYYGDAPAGLVGRGFITLISGYSHSTGRPGIYIHTNDDGYLYKGNYVWSQQARLIAEDTIAKDQFGKWIVSYNQTILVSAPYADDTYKDNPNLNKYSNGYVYVFNGTLRHWSQIQKLSPKDAATNNNFGEKMVLHNDRVVIGSSGSTVETLQGSFQSSGAVYVFERPSNGLIWSQQAKLIPRDAATDQGFGREFGLHGMTAVIGAYNDQFTGKQSGSAYIFRGSGGQWSQQQKLIALDLQNKIQGEQKDFQDKKLGKRMIGKSVAVNGQGLALGISTEVFTANITSLKRNRDSIYIWKESTELNRWSLQQRLFQFNDSIDEYFDINQVYMDHENTLMSVVRGGYNKTSSYIFKSFGNGWSLQQALFPHNRSETSSDNYTYYNEQLNQNITVTNYNPAPSLLNFTNPSLYGGTLLYGGRDELQVRTLFQNTSCLQIWMSDHFLDGWDTAVLTVRAPDLTNDTFHPHCDQIDPFYVRYCPYTPYDEGVYIIKVFSALKARFFWEISWQVMIEATGEWYKGDFATKMMFNFDLATSRFYLVSAQNLIDMNAPCYRCTSVSTQTWVDLQVTGNSAFWPLDVQGAPYYISDYHARKVYFSGRLCYNVNKYECYQTLLDGIYILRLGGGLFGRETGFPHTNANWHGCGRNGTDRDQFIFAIAKGECHPIQVYHYNTRCAQPGVPEDVMDYTTRSPLVSGTQAPTQSIFGDPYKKFHMYSISNGGDRNNDNVLQQQQEEEKNEDDILNTHTNKLLDNFLKNQGRKQREQWEEEDKKQHNPSSRDGNQLPVSPDDTFEQFQDLKILNKQQLESLSQEDLRKLSELRKKLKLINQNNNLPIYDNIFMP